MSLTSSEGRDLKQIASSLGEIAKILEAMNKNMLGLAQNTNKVLELLAQNNPASSDLTSQLEKTRKELGGKPGFPEGWARMDLVRVTDPTREEFGRDGVVIDGQVWANNAEVRVRFGEASMSSTRSWFNPTQLKKISRKDAMKAVRDSAPTVEEAGKNIAKAVEEWKKGLG